MYNDNKLRLIKNLRWEENDVETLERRMMMLPENMRHVIEVRWGLNGQDKVCPNFAILDKKMGVENSRRLYHKAIWKLESVSEFSELLVDFENYEFEESLGLGRLAKNIFNQEKLLPGSISGKKLEKELNWLPPLEKKIIRRRFFDNEPATMGDIEKEFKISTFDLWQEENRILEKLRALPKTKIKV